MLPQLPNLTSEQRRLLKLFSSLSGSERASLLAFAEFLANRAEGTEDGQSELAEPKSIQRPADESVVAAVKRLSESYFMLDRSLLLDETASLMTSHMINGRAAAEVIDELERLFQQKYQDYLQPKTPD